MFSLYFFFFARYAPGVAQADTHTQFVEQTQEWIQMEDQTDTE